MELPIFIYAIALSFFVSVWMVWKIKSLDLYLKLFPPFLLATLLAELLGPYLTSIGEHNTPFYNFFSTFEFCFYLFAISLMISEKRMKIVIRVIIPLYAIAACIN